MLLDNASAASRQGIGIAGQQIGQITFPSPLELFLPSGSAAAAQVAGSGCPARLAPRLVVEASSSVPLDLLILSFPPAAPFTLRAFEQTLDRHLTRMAPGGMIYTLAPRGQRMRIHRLLSRRGLANILHVAHLPDWQQNRFLLPLQPDLVRFSLSQVMLAPRWKLWAAHALLSLPGGQAGLSALLSCVGIAAFLPGGSPPFHWLQPSGTAAINASWRENGRSYVLFPLQPGESQPASIVKLGWNAAGNEGREAAALPALSKDAALAGANLPALLQQSDQNGTIVSRYSRVPGASAAGLLLLHPARLPEILGRLLQWLERWNARTVQHNMAAHPIHARSDACLNSLEKQLPKTYRGWLYSLGPVTTAVSVHQDLTMWNVLIAEGGQLGVIDWESAEPSGLPLGDAFYAVQDAVSIAHRLSRVDALRACLAPAGQFRGLVLPHLSRLSQALALSPREIDVCLHACFLQHAANEQQQTRPGAPKPFLDLLRWLAENQVSIGRELCA